MWWIRMMTAASVVGVMGHIGCETAPVAERPGITRPTMSYTMRGEALRPVVQTPAPLGGRFARGEGGGELPTP